MLIHGLCSIRSVYVLTLAYNDELWVPSGRNKVPAGEWPGLALETE